MPAAAPRHLALAAALLLLSGAGAAEPRGPAPEAAAAAFNCLTCHSPRAAGREGLPRLEGLSAAQMTARLRAFRAARREATIMDRITRAYSEAELARIAATLEALLP